jgi:hypothetical protein
MYHTKFAEKIKTQIYVHKLFHENFVLCGIMWKNMVQTDRPQITIKYGACASYAGYLRLQTHTQNVQHLMLFHCNKGCTNAPQCDVIRTYIACIFFVAVAVYTLAIRLSIDSRWAGENYGRDVIP